MFSENPLLTHMKSVSWDLITRGEPDSVHLATKPFSAKRTVMSLVYILYGEG